MRQLFLPQFHFSSAMMFLQLSFSSFFALLKDLSSQFPIDDTLHFVILILVASPSLFAFTFAVIVAPVKNSLKSSPSEYIPFVLPRVVYIVPSLFVTVISCALAVNAAKRRKKVVVSL